MNLNKDASVFDQVYLQYYAVLHHFAFTMLNDEIIAEEMVHQVFLKILESKQPIVLHTSLKAYLYRAVHNECLNYIKHEKVKLAYQTQSVNEIKPVSESASGNIQYQELEQQLKTAINELPEQCRTIFQMSRFEELKYAEIAAELRISIKTVENQMGKALKRLRIQLSDYLPLVIYCLLEYILGSF